MRVCNVLAAVLLLLVPGAAFAAVDIRVDLSSQTMQVSSQAGSYVWPISSARSGFHTPRGAYTVQRMELMHRSRKYHNSPMPYSLFFSGGYAIHGTYEMGPLGRPASHGCIRLSPGHAAELYRMVEAEGARIRIRGVPPGGENVDAGRSRHTASAERTRWRQPGQALGRGYDEMAPWPGDDQDPNPDVQLLWEDPTGL